MNQKYLLLFLLLFFSYECFSQDSSSSEVRHTVIRNGIGLGTVLAAITSWDRNKSVLLAFIHGIFSWLYVIYFVLTRKREE